ncbi:hypothetical protein BC567DRAFT_52261 [Phyllosticta citribraziliensis]
MSSHSCLAGQLRFRQAPVVTFSLYYPSGQAFGCSPVFSLFLLATLWTDTSPPRLTANSSDPQDYSHRGGCRRKRPRLPGLAAATNHSCLAAFVMADDCSLGVTVMADECSLGVTVIADECSLGATMGCSNFTCN